MVVRVLLYNTRNQLFFQPDQNWSGDLCSALDFGGMVPAVNLACERKFLKDTAVICEFDDPRFNMVLPLEAGH